MPITDPEKLRQRNVRIRNKYRLAHGIPLDAPVALCGVRYATEEERQEARRAANRRAGAKQRAKKREAERPLREAKRAASEAEREQRRKERERRKEWARIASEAAKRKAAKCLSKSGNGTIAKSALPSPSLPKRKRGRILAMSGWLGW